MAVTITPSISIEGLKKAGATYDKTLATIMPAMFGEAAKELGIGLYKMTNNQHNLRTFIRKGSLLRPYKLGADLNHDELGEVSERELNIRHSVIATKDDISRYADNDAFEAVSFNPAAPKHPLEKVIVFAIAKTMAEDILDNLFFAEYDSDGAAAAAAFDGYFPLIEQAVAAGEIDEAKGNIYPIEELAVPADADDYEAYTALIAWLEKASPKLLRGRGTRLLMPQSAALCVKQAYANKVKAFADPEWERIAQAIKSEVMSPNLQIVVSPYLGSGSRMILTSVVDDVSLTQNMVFGYNQDPDKVFLNINQSPDNVNVVYFQSDIKVGAQIRSFNKNVFYTTGGSISSNTPPVMSGDE
jgi:hypothetical protein